MEHGEEYLICENCGNTETFQIDQNVTIFGAKTIRVDGHGEHIEEIDFWKDDEEENDIFNDCCDKCRQNNGEVRYCDSEKDRLEFKWKHTGRTGKWFKRELKEEYRNEKLKVAILAEEL